MKAEVHIFISPKEAAPGVEDDLRLQRIWGEPIKRIESQLQMHLVYNVSVMEFPKKMGIV